MIFEAFVFFYLISIGSMTRVYDWGWRRSPIIASTVRSDIEEILFCADVLAELVACQGTRPMPGIGSP